MRDDPVLIETHDRAGLLTERLLRDRDRSPQSFICAVADGRTDFRPICIPLESKMGPHLSLIGRCHGVLDA